MSIKVLALPSTIPFFKKWLDLSAEECMKEYCGYIKEIPPVFHRDGMYYDTRKKLCWVEFDGKAFEYDAIENFLYDLKLLDHRPLPRKVVKAINVLKAYGTCPKDLLALLQLDAHYKECVRLERTGYASLQRVRRKRAELEDKYNK